LPTPTETDTFAQRAEHIQNPASDYEEVNPLSLGTPNSTADQLKQYADRIENLLNEIDGLKDDLKDLKAEIKSQGFNVRALEKLVAIRRKDAADKETELINDLLLYAHATGTHLDLALPEGDAPAGEEEQAA
jgi:uncharacterized protein (UPF0335 family)